MFRYFFQNEASQAARQPGSSQSNPFIIDDDDDEEQQKAEPAPTSRREDAQVRTNVTNATPSSTQSSTNKASTTPLITPWSNSTLPRLSSTHTTTSSETPTVSRTPTDRNSLTNGISLSLMQRTGAKDGISPHQNTTTVTVQTRHTPQQTASESALNLALHQKAANTNPDPTNIRKSPLGPRTAVSKQSSPVGGSLTSAPLTEAEKLQPTLAIVEECLQRHLDQVHDEHAYIVKATLARQRTCFEREHRQRQRLIMQDDVLPSTKAEMLVHKVSPFKSMQSTRASTEQKVAGEKLPTLHQEVFSKARSKESFKSMSIVPYSSFISTAVIVPEYQEYVTIHDSVLAENENKLETWSAFLDNKSRREKADDLEENFNMEAEEDEYMLLRDVYRFYESSVDLFLEKLGITWGNVFYWYLASNSDIKRIDSAGSASSSKEFNDILLERHKHLPDGFDRSKPKWANLFLDLPSPSYLKLRLAALACSSFSRNKNFDLWDIARRSGFMEKIISENLKGTNSASGLEYRTAACRVCHLHNCPSHGELREKPEPPQIFDTAQEDSDDDAYAPSSSRKGARQAGASSTSKKGRAALQTQSDTSDSDSDIYEVINYRHAVNTGSHSSHARHEEEHDDDSNPSYGGWDALGIDATNSGKWNERGPFYPCRHEGTCEQAQCQCYQKKIHCEKTCACSPKCKRRFPGCACSKVTSQKTSGKKSAYKQQVCETSACLCIQFKRECDADLCGGCGATDILDPVNTNKASILEGRCRNVAIQRRIHKKTLLGESQVHGWGVYVCEDVNKDDYLGEYVGEVIAQEERVRREIIYVDQPTWYTFHSNKDRDIDSTRLGNKTRFINDADDEHSNCYADNLLCNTVSRIGIFALTDLKAGTELFFNYGYPASQRKDFVQPPTQEEPTTTGRQGRVVAVKSKGQKKVSSVSASSTSLPTGRRRTQSSDPKSARRRQTQNARAALSAKHTAKREAAVKASPQLQFARKSALSYPLVIPRSFVTQGSVDAQDEDNDSHDHQDSLGQLDLDSEIEETDEEEDAEETDAASSTKDKQSANKGIRSSIDNDSAAPPARRSLRRRGLSPALVAVKRRGGHRSGRSGTAQKRKRMLAELDDDSDE